MKNPIAYYTKTANAKTAGVTSAGIATIFTAGADGSKVLMINLITLTGTPTDLVLYVNDGVTNHLIYKKATPAAADDILDGTLLPKAANGMRYVNLEAGWSLRSTVTGAGTATVAVYGEDY